MQIRKSLPLFTRGLMALALGGLLNACSTSGQAMNPLQAGNLAGTASVAGGTADAGSVQARAILRSPRTALRGQRGLGVAYVAASRGPAIVPVQPAEVHHDANTVVYDSIGATVGPKNQLSSYIASEGYDCCSVAEFGDGVIFTQAGGRLKTVEVVMDSWACQENAWYEASCSSAPNSTFSLPITLNIYSVTGYPSGVPSVGELIATRTQTFDIKYRPSANVKDCSGPNLGAFIGPVDKECDFGIAQGISFNMTSPKTILPAQAIITVAFNTSSWGYQPYGTGTSCFNSSGGCPYDSLNVSANGNGALAGEGGNIDPNGTFVNFQDPAFYCPGNPYGQPPGNSLVIDTPCWTGYHPEIEVTTY
jgi:hypothetical protein